MTPEDREAFIERMRHVGPAIGTLEHVRYIAAMQGDDVQAEHVGDMLIITGASEATKAAIQLALPIGGRARWNP
jgi:hypothetical protein